MRDKKWYAQEAYRIFDNATRTTRHEDGKYCVVGKDPARPVIEVVVEVAEVSVGNLGGAWVAMWGWVPNPPEESENTSVTTPEGVVQPAHIRELEKNLARAVRESDDASEAREKTSKVINDRFHVRKPLPLLPKFLTDIPQEKLPLGKPMSYGPDVDATFWLFADVIHSLLNNTIRHCGVEVEDSYSERTWATVQEFVTPFMGSTKKALNDNRVEANEQRLKELTTRELALMTELSAVRDQIHDLCETKE